MMLGAFKAQVERWYVKHSELGSALPQTGVGLEDAAGLSGSELAECVK